MTEEERSEQQWNRAILALAYWRLGGEYHSGGSSLGYRKLSQASRILGRLEFGWGGSPENWDSVRDTAAAILRKRRRYIMANW